MTFRFPSLAPQIPESKSPESRTIVTLSSIQVEFIAAFDNASSGEKKAKTYYYLKEYSRSGILRKKGLFHEKSHVLYPDNGYPSGVLQPVERR
jgi:hypothetical protein